MCLVPSSSTFINTKLITTFVIITILKISKTSSFPLVSKDQKTNVLLHIDIFNSPKPANFIKHHKYDPQVELKPKKLEHSKLSMIPKSEMDFSVDNVMHPLSMHDINQVFIHHPLTIGAESSDNLTGYLSSNLLMESSNLEGTLFAASVIMHWILWSQAPKYIALTFDFVCIFAVLWESSMKVSLIG